MTTTPVGRVGRVVSAPSEPSLVGRFIEVVDDTAGPTGGAYICTWLGRAGYDSWVESVDDVDDFIVQASLVVEWFEAPPADSLDGRPRHA